MSRPRSRMLALFSAMALITSLVPAASAAKPTPPPAPTRPKADRAIFFASDGMRPDLMEGFAAAGDMPTYKAVMDAGVKGANGLKQAFPPNTGVGWYTMATGTYPSEHGSTNNTFFRSGDTFSNRTSWRPAVSLVTSNRYSRAVIEASKQCGRNRLMDLAGDG